MPHKRPKSKAARKRRGGHDAKPAHARPHAAHSSHAASQGHSGGASARPAGGGRKRRGGRGRKRGGGAKGGAAGNRRSVLTSHPTTRNAFVATREWLLEQHGPVCAYCGTRHQARTMTLDHVAPRRGQTAYDRRDNLVLACKDCNQKKRDLAPLAFMLGLRSRAVNLLRYGAHLSSGLLDLARSLVPEEHRPESRRHQFEDDDSPYRD